MEYGTLHFFSFQSCTKRLSDRSLLRRRAKMIASKRPRYLAPGVKIGHLFCVEQIGHKENGDNLRPLWRVNCDCGRTLDMTNHQIKKNEFCGHACKLQKRQTFVGFKMGRFECLERLSDKKIGTYFKPLWRIKCDCGCISSMTRDQIRRRTFCSPECGFRGRKE